VRRLLVIPNVVLSSPILVTLMMEALCSSETIVTRATRHNVSEDGILRLPRDFHIGCPENSTSETWLSKHATTLIQGWDKSSGNTSVVLKLLYNLWQTHLHSFNIIAPMCTTLCQFFGKRRTPSARPFLLMSSSDRPTARKMWYVEWEVRHSGGYEGVSSARWRFVVREKSSDVSEEHVSLIQSRRISQHIPIIIPMPYCGLLSSAC
jgi:hypothetical protein